MDRSDLDFQQYMARKVNDEVLTSFHDDRSKEILDVYDIVLAGVV